MRLQLICSTIAVAALALAQAPVPHDLNLRGDRFKPLTLFSVPEIAGSWEKAQAVHFSDGGIFDQIYQKN